MVVHERCKGTRKQEGADTFVPAGVLGYDVAVQRDTLNAGAGTRKMHLGCQPMR